MAIITKTIGSAAGRDYPTIQAWFAALPANLVTDGNSQLGLMYNDSEFVTSSFTLSGKTTDATHTITLQPATGQSFTDNANVQTNALRYNAANGVAVRFTDGYSTGLSLNQDYFFLNGVQFLNDGGGNSGIVVGMNTSAVHSIISTCIIGSTKVTGGYSFIAKFSGGKFNSCVFYSLVNIGNGVIYEGNDTVNVVLENCTIATSSTVTSTGNAVGNSAAGKLYVKNCAIFGFSNNVGSGNTSQGVAFTNCASDKAFTGYPFTTSTGCIPSLVYADQFVGTTTAGLDFRLKSTSALIDAGTTTSTADTMAVNGPRVAGTAADIGAWETVAQPASAVAITGNISGDQFATDSLRISTDHPLTGAQSVNVTFSDGAGGAFSPTSVTLSTSNLFQFVTYTPTSTLGSRTVTAHAVGTPTLADATFAYTVTAPAPASAVTLSGPATLNIGTSVTLTLSTDHVLLGGQSEVITLSDGAGGTFGTNPITLNQTVSSFNVAYTPKGTAGSRTVTASASGTPTLTNGTYTATAAPATPVLVTGANTYEVGTGHQFADMQAFASFINGKDLVAANAQVTVYVFNNGVWTSGWSATCDATHKITITSGPGLDFGSVSPTGAQYYPAAVELTIGGIFTVSGGVILTKIELTRTDTGSTNIGYGYGQADSAVTNCRIKATSTSAVIAFGAYATNTTFTSNVCLRTASTGAIVAIGDSNGDIVGNTFVANGTATGNCGLSVGGNGGGGNFQDNAFVNCGTIPISGVTSRSTAAKYKNNYTNVTPDSAQTAMLVGLVVDTTNPFVTNVNSDLRPAAGGALIGKGNSLVVSTNDNLFNNRGTTPDVGALQLVPATPLPGLTVTSQTADGQTVTISLSTTNAPTSGTAMLSPDSTNPNGAVAQGPVALTLGTNTATVSFAAVPVGNYTASFTAQNAGGITSYVAPSGIVISGISGNPQAGANQAPAANVVISGPVSGTVNAASSDFSVGVDGAIAANITVNLNSSVVGDTFAPLSVVLTPTATVATFKLTPSSVGNRTITLTNNGGLANPTPPTYNSLALPATVSSVAVTPGTYTGTAQQQFVATVTGTNSPSQAVTWTATVGMIDSIGLFTPPKQTSTAQIITVTATSVLDNTKSGSATVTVPALAQTVTSVTVSPATATGSRQFFANVVGTNNPSQSVAWTASAGVIDSSGNFTAPAQTDQVQTITITARSLLDNSKYGTAVATIAAIVVVPGGGGNRSVAIQLFQNDGVTPATNLTGFHVSFFDQSVPSAFTTPVFVAANQVTDASGIMRLTLPNSTLTPGGTGFLIVSNTTGIPGVSCRGFAGPVTVS